MGEPREKKEIEISDVNVMKSTQKSEERNDKTKTTNEDFPESLFKEEKGEERIGGIIRSVIFVSNVAIGMRIEKTWRITKREDIQRNVKRNLCVRMKENSNRKRSIEVELY